MARRASKHAVETAAHSSRKNRQALLAGLAVALWFLTCISIASRTHLVMGYTTLAAGPPWLEPLLASLPALVFAAVVGGTWFVGTVYFTRTTNGQCQAAIRQSTMCLLLASLPALASAVRVFSSESLAAAYWEPLWLAAWTGMSFVALTSPLPGAGKTRFELWLGSSGVAFVCSAIVASWFFAQSVWYYDHYLFGFNDFGQFLLRVANTAEGRGFLLETPVRRIYWDHFNPGLVLLVPFWKLFPYPHFVFALQAICLAGSGLVVRQIALARGYSTTSALVWSLAWMAQPALGQMNIAYTYGWHPISIAIPLMLLTLLGTLKRKFWWVVVAGCFAMSMEESVILMFFLFSSTCALLTLLPTTTRLRLLMHDADDVQEASGVLGFSRKYWMSVASATFLIFVAVYFFSGIREFQTGRFVALGDNTLEVLFSPVLRPSVFWGELLKPSKAAFVLSLLLPCGVFGLWRGRVWLLACLLPLGVLLVWDHLPAACLAFQYASVLLPIFWFAAMAVGRSHSLRWGCGALVTGLVLSQFVGQLPYSSPSILGIVLRTYGTEQELSRGPTTELGQFLNAQVRRIQADGSAVLATGRIAAHLVGNADVETVGQYYERRPELEQLPDRLGNPIGHYRWIIADRGEFVQQQDFEVDAVLEEAMQFGFEGVAELEDVVVLQAPLRD